MTDEVLTGFGPTLTATGRNNRLTGEYAFKNGLKNGQKSVFLAKFGTNSALASAILGLKGSYR